MKKGNRWLRRGTLMVLGVVTMVVGARPVARAWERWERAAWHQRVLAAYAQLRASHDDAMPAIEPPGREPRGEPEQDDPTIRRLFTLAYFGEMTPDASEQLLHAARNEAARWPGMMRSRAPLPQAAVAGQSWLNLGPTDARIQSNGGVYNGIDSGRAAAIRVDPRNKDVVYVATAWGGLWKTYNFTAAQPTWHPISDTVGGLAVGALELDPSNPDTLYLGLGDALDSSVAGGAIFKSTDGGGTWTMLTARLSGTYPAAAGAKTESAIAIRDIAVDRSDANKLLVATDVGLFRSVDGGANFALVPLPDNLGTQTLEQSTWTIAYLGAAGGQSAWVVSGMDACGTGLPPPGFGRGQPVGATTPTACPGGTLGDIWRSSDSGATWTSLRFTSKLPTPAALGSDYGRMALAAGPTTNPDATVVYAQVANIDDANSKQLAVFKSTDGGKSFTAPATALAATAVSNPATGCPDMNVAHGQAWYNLAIAVDPTDANHLLVGGNLCGVRSLDGGATWSNVSHWLPRAGNTLPYVHADWHTVHISNAGGSVTAFTGSDGGLFSTSDVFSAGAGAATWNYTNNRGIATHLFYGVSSGDPTAGDDNVVFGGLQDNGTRFRDLDPALGKPTTFNQIIGADGFGTALVRGPAAVGTVFWASIYSQRFICIASAVICSTDDTQWNDPGLTMANGTTDPDPFVMRYAVVDDDPSGALITPTTYHIFKVNYDAGNTLTATRLTDAATAGAPGPLGGSIRNVAASPFTYKDAGNVSFRLYGAALTGGKFAVGIDKAGTTTWKVATAQLGIGPATDKTKTMKSTTAIAFPSSAAHFSAGAADGDVYIAGSTAPRMDDGRTVVPDTIGRLFLTTDGGASYQPFHGDLPNVPVQAIVFDPSDTSDNTIFVGNDLGVYQTTDMGKTWHRYGVGLPMVRVTEIRIAKNSGVMRIGTYGRGLWEIYPNATAAPGVRGDGDWDRNLAIDFLDLGATASRLGATPATTTQPYYDWHLDAVGTVNGIAEDDLTALVAKFGSNP